MVAASPSPAPVTEAPPARPVSHAFSAMTPVLAVIWLLSGVTMFGFLSFRGFTLRTAILLAIVTLLYVRGIFTILRRWATDRELVRERTSLPARIVDVGRAGTWRRFIVLTVITGGYFGVTGLILQMDPKDAALQLPGLILTVATTIGYFLIIMLAQFSIFFGPFLLYARIGLDATDPGDASWQVKISDVRGQKSAVDEMKKILHLIEQGRKYIQSGGLRERGILMVGPPGTGKTMLAKAIASSLQLPIIVTSGASFAGMFFGMDILKVLMMSRMAKKRAKKWGGCAVFIDEFDALGSRRSGMGGAGGMAGGMFGMGGMMALNMLLVVMDGLDNPGVVRRTLRKFVNSLLDASFIIPQRIPLGGTRSLPLRVPPLKPPRYNIFFMGATNRPQVLDEAVTRPGRFGRQIFFKMPDFEDRKDIADLYFTKVRHDKALDATEMRDEFARITKGYSPAMIQQALSVALMYAFEHAREGVIWEDLRESMGNIEAGLAEAVKYTPKDALGVARHEMGHAIASRFFVPDTQSVRLSIRKRPGMLGHHRTVEAEETFTMFRSRLAGEIRHSLGSIASERAFYGENASGVSADLANATSLAAQMVGIYGMGPDLRSDEESLRAQQIGERLVSRAAATGSALEGNVIATVLSNHNTARDVAQILGLAYVDVWRLMVKNREAIDRLAHVLVEKQELVGREIDELLNSVTLAGPDGADAWPDFFFSVDGGQHLCPRCRRLLPEGSRYCFNCGESMFSPLNPAQGQTTAPRA
jgi:ATP-dependent Zn protease